MIQYLNKLEEDRMLLLRQTDRLTEDQYNKIPPGFNNNIIWNMGHLLVVSENLLYRNIPFQRPVHEFDLAPFKRGEKPETFIVREEILLIRDALLEAVGFYKKCIGLDAILADSPATNQVNMGFLLFHEKMHYQTIDWLMQQIDIN